MMHNTNQTHFRFIYPVSLLIATTIYVLLFWDLPLSEDAGYYAFLSRSMLNGMILHNDTPVMTNSLLLYVATWVFKFFGANKLSFRMLYAVGYILLVLMVYQTIIRQRSLHEAFVASSICALFIMIPHIMLDLGRNQIIWCLAFIMLGTHLKFNKQQHFMFGFCLAIAALMRETFLIVVILWAVVYCMALMKHRHDFTQRRLELFALYTYLSGAALGLSINAVILTYYHSWGTYLTDMLHSGTAFRYQHIFAIKHLLNNLGQFRYGFTHYYNAIIVYALLSYLFPAKQGSIINALKFIFLPIYFIEAIIVNRTETYSIVPILVTTSILATYFWFELFRKISQPYSKKIFAIQLYGCLYFAGLYAVFTIPNALWNIYGTYISYYRILATGDTYPQNFTTERIKNIINQLPSTHMIGTQSMYPLLFEMTTSVEYSYPYLYDISAPLNLKRGDLAHAQNFALSLEGADILILKHRMDLPYYFTKTDVIAESIKQHYLTIASFEASTESTVTKYKNQVLLSKRFFNQHYSQTVSTTNIIRGTNIKLFNHDRQTAIAKVTTKPANCISSVELKSGTSQIHYAELNNARLELYSLIAPYEALSVRQIKPCKNAPAMKIIATIYARKLQHFV